MPRSRSTTPGGPYQGRIYVKNRYEPEGIWAFEPSGAEVGGNFPLAEAGNGMAVSPANGNFFVSGVPLESRAYEYSPNGLKTGVVVDMSQNGYTYGEIEAGPHAEVFAFSGELGIQKYNTASELIDHFPAGGSTIFGDRPGLRRPLSVRYEHAADFDPNGNELPGIDYSEEPRSVAIDGINHRTYFGYGGRVDLFQPQPAVTIPGAQPEPPTNIEPTSLTLNALVEPEGVDTTKCNFEIGTVFEYGTVYYEESVPCEQGQVIDGGSADAGQRRPLRPEPGRHIPLPPRSHQCQWHLQEQGQNGPSVGQAGGRNPYVDTVHSDSVVFHAEITPEGAPTTFHVLYGTGDCDSEPETCDETPETSSIGVGPQRRSGDRQPGRAAGRNDLPLRDRRHQPERQHRIRRSAPSPPSPTPPFWKTNATTRTFASRPAPPSSPTAGPTSWSRRRSPATTSSPT